MYRTSVAILVAALVVISAGWFTRAQPAPAPVEEPVWRDINLAGLPLVTAQGINTPPAQRSYILHSAMLTRWLPMTDFDEYVQESPPGNWSPGLHLQLEHGLTAADLALLLEEFCSGLDGAEFDYVPEVMVMSMRGTQSQYQRVDGVVSAIRRWFDASVSCDVYELPAPLRATRIVKSEVAALATRSIPLATLSGEVGEPLLVRQWKPVRFLAQFEVMSLSDVRLPEPTAAMMPDGRELAVNILPGPNGEVWVNAAVTDVKVGAIRVVRAANGKVEAPHFTARDSSLAMRLAPGEGVVLDGRLLLVPRVAGSPPLMDTTDPDLWLVAAFAQAMPGLRHVPWPGDSVRRFGYDVDRSNESEGLTSGPWPAAKSDSLGNIRDPMQDDLIARTRPLGHWRKAGRVLAARPETFKPPLDQETLQRVANTGARGHAFRLRLHTVASKDVPAGVWQGRVSNGDLAALQTAGVNTIEGTLASFEGCVATMFDGQSAAYLRGMEANYQREHTDMNPVLHLAIGGFRADLRATHKDSTSDVTLDAVWGTPPSPAPLGVTVANSDTTLEGARVATAVFKLRASMAVGGRAAQVMPHPTDSSQRLVLILERLE